MAELDERAMAGRTLIHKYHALGNDYLVLPADQPLAHRLDADTVRRICDRHFGAGSDGILLGPLASSPAEFRLRIFNPDGSEAEKSGNGLRIFCRYLFDRGLVGTAPFRVETLGGVVGAQVFDEGRRVRVEMGRVSFDSRAIPVSGAAREVIMETLHVADRSFQFCAATVGNPHCVIPLDRIDAALAKRYGPLIEVAPIFPNRTNVQFMEVIDATNIRIEIWERGAGYTFASGSSSCAAAAVAHRLGRCGNTLTVHMPGGIIAIDIDADFGITQTGPVSHVFDAQMRI